MTRKPSSSKTKKSEFHSNDSQKQPIGSVELMSKTKIDVKCKTENQKKLVNAIKQNDVVICVGPAGSGKTYLSCAESLLLLKNNDSIKKIVIIKSVTPLKGEEIGWVKGGVNEKMEPFIYSFMSNFEKIVGKFILENLKNEGIIETLPIAYMRGINIDDAIIIVDELQNISTDNIKTILTRLGSNSKLIMLGDTSQVDMKNKKDSSLDYLINKISKKPQEGVDIVKFDENDIVRHKLTKYFISLFDEDKKSDI